MPKKTHVNLNSSNYDAKRKHLDSQALIVVVFSDFAPTTITQTFFGTAQTLLSTGILRQQHLKATKIELNFFLNVFRLVQVLLLLRREYLKKLKESLSRANVQKASYEFVVIKRTSQMSSFAGIRRRRHLNCLRGMSLINKWHNYIT